MTGRQGLLLLLLAVLGYGGLALLFPRYHPAAQWHYELDRPALIARAQGFARQQGVDVAGWAVSLQTSRDRSNEQFLRERAPDDLLKPYLAPLKARLVFRDPKVNRTVSFLYTAQGQLLSFTRTGLKLSEGEKATPPNPQLATQAVAELLRNNRPAFVAGTESEPEKGTRKMTWAYHSRTEPELKTEVEAVVTGAQLTSLEIKNTLPKAYQDDLSRRALTSIALIGGLGFIVNVGAGIAALLLYFLSLNRKEVDHLSTLLFFSLALPLFLADNTWTGLLDQLKRGDTIQGVAHPTAMIVLPYLLVGLFSFVFALFVTAFWAAGEAIHAKYHTGHLAVFASALRGKLWNRALALRVAAGLLVGGLIAALPYVFARLSGAVTTPAEWTTVHDSFTPGWPGLALVLTATVSGNFYYLILLFAFLAPAVLAYVRPRWLANGIMALAGVVFLLEASPNQPGAFSLKILVSLALFLVFAWLYRTYDLVAVLAANLAAALSIKSYGLLLQPAPTLHAAGIKGFVTLGILGLIALVLARIAPQTELEPRRLLYPTEDQAERERLKAEFGVARRAQENLLPAAAPQIPGFGIAALCRPARECGGDLYDFIPLADGKLGIVVADVSGKGVPAALYMTLTKGLLLSVSEEHSDPGEILRVVNRHLYEACKRKVFVTLFFGVLDPATKTLTYARAGHNPTVWRKQGEQTTQLLKSAGIGLGLNAGKSFDRVLTVETIRLSRNDLLIFYSDGITEAMNEQQEEYGEERLMQIAAVTDGMGAEESLSAVLAHVSNFLGRMLPQDDQTLVVVRVT